MEEPSVLDYIKSLLTPWKGEPIKIPPAEEEREAAVPTLDERNAPSLDSLPDAKHLVEEAGEELSPEPIVKAPPASQSALSEAAQPEPSDSASLTEPTNEPEERNEAITRSTWPWRATLAVILALIAQSALAPPDRSVNTGVAFLLLSVIFVAWGVFQGEWQATPLPFHTAKKDPLTLRPVGLGIGAVLAVLTFLASSNNLFSRSSILFLGLSLLSFLYALWQVEINPKDWILDLREFISERRWNFRITTWGLLVLASTALVLFFRLYQLGQVPPEMVSDHAEKYLDVKDILNGQPHIFFPRNGGREALQFYLLAALHLIFNAELSHLTLKISTVLVGLLSLPFLYLLGKEIGNRRVALLAFTFAGIAYWTNVVSRAGMRLPFYFLFTAAVLYFLIRGIRRLTRNDFIVAGLFLGLGMYGYSADRLLPLVVIAAVGLFLLHPQSKGHRGQTVLQTLMMVLMSLVVFTPLLRYITEDPQGFSFRMMSRMGTLEQPLPGPALEIFLDNLWRALTMFSWSGGVVWGVSIPDYPALGVVSGGLFYIGAALLIVRYLRKRNWFDLFLIISIPILMLPSIMALAFPSENPNLYRTGGAMVPVFLMIAIALDSLMTSLETYLRRPWGKSLAWAALVLLLGWSLVQNYDLVFNTFYKQYRLSAWNTSEIGQVINSFSNNTGSPDTAWVMGYPHWVDTRLVAINAGYIDRDYAMFVERLETTRADPGPKLFILHPEDQPAIEALPQFYPHGWFQTYDSQAETKDFLMFFVPPDTP